MMFKLPASFVANLYIAWHCLLPSQSSLPRPLEMLFLELGVLTFPPNKIILYFQIVTTFLVDTRNVLIVFVAHIKFLLNVKFQSTPIWLHLSDYTYLTLKWIVLHFFPLFDSNLLVTKIIQKGLVKRITLGTHIASLNSKEGGQYCHRRGSRGRHAWTGRQVTWKYLF